LKEVFYLDAAIRINTRASTWCVNKLEAIASNSVLGGPSDEILHFWHSSKTSLVPEVVASVRVQEIPSKVTAGMISLRKNRRIHDKDKAVSGQNRRFDVYIRYFSADICWHGNR
jgi:hypothetical protein